MWTAIRRSSGAASTHRYASRSGPRRQLGDGRDDPIRGANRLGRLTKRSEEPVSGGIDLSTTEPAALGRRSTTSALPNMPARRSRRFGSPHTIGDCGEALDLPRRIGEMNRTSHDRPQSSSASRRAACRPQNQSFRQHHHPSTHNKCKASTFASCYNERSG